MKLLLDACVWPGAAAELESCGHEVLRVCDFPDNPSEEEILALALREDRIVVTLDKDFGELAVAFGRSHAGIIAVSFHRLFLGGLLPSRAHFRFAGSIPMFSNQAGAIPCRPICHPISVSQSRGALQYPVAGFTPDSGFKQPATLTWQRA